MVRQWCESQLLPAIPALEEGREQPFDLMRKTYAALAPETPPVYSSPVDAVARIRRNLAYSLSAEHYMKYGEAGLMEAIRKNLAEAATDVRRYADREHKLRAGK